MSGMDSYVIQNTEEFRNHVIVTSLGFELEFTLKNCISAEVMNPNRIMYVCLQF